jgi:hypothetical protein
MRTTNVGRQRAVGQVGFEGCRFPRKLARGHDWFGAEAATLSVELSHGVRQHFSFLLLLVLAVTGLGCSPQISSLGTLTMSTAGTAGVAGPRGGAAGSAGATFVGTAGTGATIGPFGPPRAIPTLLASGMVTTDPCVTGDGLLMYMMSTRSGNKDLLVSTRASSSVEWAEPTPVTELNTDYVESNCKISPDGLSLWFYSDRDRAQGTLWETRRATIADVWGTPTVIPGICDTSASDVAAALDEPQLNVVFSSLRSGTAAYDLFEARRASSSVTFEQPSLIAGLNSAQADYDPYLSPDGLTLVFHSDRSGNDDIYWAKRAGLNSPFSAPVPLAEINSTANDIAPAMAADQSAIWFASTRDGDERIYVATVVR